jgi:tetratricopeptide (TPR) repeat protein
MFEYRDPLFNIILFLSLIAITILITNILGTLKNKNKIKHLKEFVEKFDFLDDKEIKSLLSDKISTNALLLLALGFEKEGNYEKSLNIYLVLLENSSAQEKFAILQNMAEVYFKAGFLHKSREALLEILRSYPRRLDALKLLFIVDDKLKNYDEMDNIIEILEELEENVDKEKAYLSFKKALFNDDKEKIRNLYKTYPILKRDYVNYFLYYNPKEVFDNITNDDVYEMIDIFWRNENLPLKNEAFLHIKAAKKEITTTLKAPIFELEILKYLPKNLADLEFEYICTNCKHLFPLYEERCPHCKALFSFKVETSITKF